MADRFGSMVWTTTIPKDYTMFSKRLIPVRYRFFSAKAGLLIAVLTTCTLVLVMKSSAKAQIRADPTHGLPDILLDKDDKQEQGSAKAGYFNITSSKHGFVGLTITEAQVLLGRLIVTPTVSCESVQRFGRRTDGGYEVCMDPPFTLQPDTCIVYSFGIGDRWSFDDAVNKHGCEVHAFDPTMDVESHERRPRLHFHNVGIWDTDTVNDKGWKLNSWTTLTRKLGHEGKILDLVKVDVEGAEWPFLAQILTTDSIKYIKQLIFEIHAPHRGKSSIVKLEHYIAMFNGLAALREQYGFKLYQAPSTNHCCKAYPIVIPANTVGNTEDICCLDMNFINTKYSTS